MSLLNPPYFPEGSGEGIPDAPEDGSTYGRNDGAWAVVSGGGGSQTLAQTLALGNDANGLNITNLADPVNPQDAMTRQFFFDEAVVSNQNNTWSDFGGASLSLDPANPGNALVATTSLKSGVADVGQFFNTVDPSGIMINGFSVFTASGAALNANLANNAINDENGLEIATNYLRNNGDASGVTFNTLPTSDPGVAGAPWNNLGILTISSG